MGCALEWRKRYKEGNSGDRERMCEGNPADDPQEDRERKKERRPRDDRSEDVTEVLVVILGDVLHAELGRHLDVGRAVLAVAAAAARGKSNG
jgi:hypothetical protein